MPVLTVLNHGTSNSSKGDPTLVITKLESLLGGKSGQGDWMINQGAGSGQLAMQRLKSHLDLPGWQTLGGIFWGKGVDENVEKAYEWIRYRIHSAGKNAAGTFTVNLAGHSRGSITCFKIANRLHKSDATTGCHVNIFAIDPVAGNLGMINSGVYKDIVLQSNIDSAYMFLAETERRTAFRPYIDKRFIQGLYDHRMDTIPGNHGGINELKASARHESADVVLHHAISFLRRNGTNFTDGAEVNVRVKDDAELMHLYATIMDHFMEYKKQGKTWDTYMFPGGNSKGGRVFNREGLNKAWLEKNKFEGAGNVKNDSGVVMGRRPRPNRFFANLDHEDLFQRNYGETYVRLMEAQKLDGEMLTKKVEQMQTSVNCGSELQAMPVTVSRNLTTWMDVALG